VKKLGGGLDHFENRGNVGVQEKPDQNFFIEEDVRALGLFGKSAFRDEADGNRAKAFFVISFVESAVGAFGNRLANVVVVNLVDAVATSCVEGDVGVVDLKGKWVGETKKKKKKKMKRASVGGNCEGEFVELRDLRER
jgi:hypothetical protein